MAVELRLPKLSDEMKEGTVSRWLKQPGDAVRKGEPVVEIETEKVIVEVEAPADGVLVEIVAREQDVVPVDALLCRIGQAGEAPAAGAKATPAHATPAKAAVPAPRPASVQPVPAAVPAMAPPPTASNVVPMVQPGQDPGSAPPATPLARRIAAELGIDLNAVQGSGIGGKIVKTDLQPYLSQVAVSQPMAAPVGTAVAFARPAAAGVPALSPSGVPPAQGAAYADVPHTPLRRTVARRMAEAKQQIPHFYMTAEIDVTDLLALRQRLNETVGGETSPAGTARKITVNDMLIKAIALTLERVPEANAHFGEQAIRRFHEAHIGFAVAIDGGLVTPVVRDCHLKSIGRIAQDTAELIARAKSRKLMPADLEGGTFTLSNMGMYDVIEFAAIINPPQVAILAVARPQELPVVRDGRIVVRSHLRATISADHRALDGVSGAHFLRELKTILEEPVRLML